MKKRKASKEQTMTLHTRAATDDIYDLFNQPLQPEQEESESEESSEDDEDMTDGEYTSGNESTGTGHLAGTSEAGDDETSEVKSVSEWSEFTARKHIPDLDEDEADTRATGFTDAEEDFEAIEPEIPFISDMQDQENELVTPVSPDLPPTTRTLFVPIPPEDYEPPTRPYRDPSQVSQNRLPFMTPIAEKTESSLGLSTYKQETDYFNAKTPSKENRSLPPVRLNGMDSSPFRDVIEDGVLMDKIAQPLLSKSKQHRRRDSSPDVVVFNEGCIIESPRGPSPPKKQKVTLHVETNKPAPLCEKLKTPTTVTVKEIPRKGPIIQDAQCNPVDDYTRNMILTNIQPPLSTFEGFSNNDEIRGRSSEIKKFAKAAAKMSRNASDKTTTNITMPPILCFPGTDTQYMLKRQLGEGAFAPVYLLETMSTEEDDTEEVAVMNRGQFATHTRKSLSALKMEDPPTAWEFYMMRTAKRRLGVSRAADSIIHVYEMHLYRDECYLIEEFRDQGTLLDIINLARAEPTSSGPGVMDENLVMFFAIELFRTMEALHSHDVLHGDLKADNCLVRLDPVGDDDVWTSKWRKDGTGGWDKKGVALIDFGRGIDMKAFRPDVQFIADWKTGPQDCAEMRELRPWTYQIDYHGLAGIIHSMLFGKYIDTVSTSTGGIGAGAKKSWKIKENFKRYWQGDIWSEVFDLLLNPTNRVENEEGQKMPVLKGMRAVREMMEAWLEGNSEKGVGLQGTIRKFEASIGAKAKKARKSL